MAWSIRPPSPPPPAVRCREGPAALPAALPAARWNSRGLAGGPGASPGKPRMAAWRWFESGAGADEGQGPRAYCRR